MTHSGGWKRNRQIQTYVAALDQSAYAEDRRDGAFELQIIEGRSARITKGNTNER